MKTMKTIIEWVSAYRQAKREGAKFECAADVNEWMLNGSIRNERETLGYSIAYRVMSGDWAARELAR